MPHATPIDTLREEAQRQIQLLKQLLQDMQAQGLIVPPAKEEKDRATFDTDSLPKTLDMLDGEHHKLQNLEMVLAVVGTMKAGKSTSINAIVGAEVLPNRNRPMTALPTLIRHKPGVLRPRLVLQEVAPLNQLLKNLGKVLKPAKGQAPEDLNQSDPDMAELLEQIRQKQPFQTAYEGEEAIFQFLKRLNDLVRLCFEQDDPRAAFPFDQYAGVNTLPVIEVEFSHLKNTSATQGQLTLLDTPGPNEAGQQHLRHMLKDQLAKASAVLAVLDYTQLKSDADADIRQELERISETAGERMYALVNKFDQKDRNSDDAGTVKKYVAHTLMQGTVPEEHVFPVSSKQGYLASRARNELARHGRLDGGQAWVQDFGDEAFGKRWARYIDAPQETQQGANELWEDSGFSMPLEKIIVQAHQNAAFHALHSAIGKLETTSKNARDFLKACVGAQEKSVQALEKDIAALQENIDSIVQVIQNVEHSLADELNRMNKGVEVSIKEALNETNAALEKYFKEGKRIEAANLAHEKGSRKPRKKKDKGKAVDKPPATRDLLLGFRSFFDPTAGQDSNDSQDFDPSSPVIEFKHIEEAREFQQRIEDSIQQLMEASQHKINLSIQQGAESFSSMLQSQRTDAIKKISESINKNLEGFDIEIRQPQLEPELLKTSVSSMLEECIHEKTKTVTRHRRQKGVWGTVCRWFKTDDWGWESYEAEENYFQIDLMDIERSTRKGIAVLKESADEVMQQEVQPQLEAVIEEFFDVFRQKVEHVRGDLMQNLQLLESQDKAQQQAMLNNALRMSRQAEGIQKDCANLETALAALPAVAPSQPAPIHEMA